MKVLHVISGGETGGSRKHVVTLLKKFPSEMVSLAVFHEGILASEAREHGIDVHVLTQRSRYDLSVLKRLSTFINQGKYDLVHTHGPRANLFGYLIYKRIEAIWVTTIHSEPHLDFMKSGLKGQLFTRLNIYALKRADFLFAVSDKFKSNLISFGINRDKIKTIYNGIDFKEEREKSGVTLKREDLALSENDLVIAMVARLHPVKGHTLVFEALKKIKKQNVKLLVVGDGSLESDLRQTVKKLGLEKTVHFMGFRKDVEEIYNLSDIAILSSYSESFPLALLEAAKQHVPIIASDVGGVRKLIDKPDLGWVVPIGDSEGIRHALEDAYEKKRANSLKQMGSALYLHASSDFSLEHLYQSIASSYKELVSKISK